MPGYEPFLLCDFHVHTTWSDGRLSLRDVVDLYGQTERFDVLAITDHILATKDLLARLGRIATLGRRRFSVTSETFDDYMADIEKEGARAKRQYGMIVIPGAEVTQNHIRAKHNSHIVALGLTQFISADLKAKEILEEIRRQGALSVACHPHHRTTFHKAKHLYSWKTLVRSAKTWPAVRAALKSNVNVAITLFRKDSC